jgi:hypothetical protein
MVATWLKSGGKGSFAYLQFQAVLLLDNSPNDRVLNLSVVQVHSDLVADLELARRSFLGMGPQCMTERA